MACNLSADLSSCALELFQASFQTLHVTNQFPMFLAKEILIQVDLHVAKIKDYFITCFDCSTMFDVRYCQTFRWAHTYALLGCIR